MVNKTNQKLYIATIGTGASGADIAHAIYFSINDKNPDAAVFIVSKDTKEKTLPFIIEKLDSDKPDLKRFEELVEEVNEFEILHKTYFAIIRKYIKAGFHANNIVVDYTSGTKSMSAALVSAGITAGVGLISYIYGVRGEGGRVQSGSEKITSLSTNLFTTGKIINEAIILFNKNLFDAARELLSSFSDSPYPDYQDNIKFIIQLSNALNNWDKFDFKSAFEKFNEIMKDEKILKEAHRLGVGINKLTQAASRLKEKKLDDYKVIELVANAKRRANEGKYDDAVARIYRALEMIGQIEFTKEFKCETSDVNIGNIPSDIREEIKLKYFDNKNGRIQLPLFITFDLLKGKNNKMGILLFNKIEELNKVLQLRNSSILAHGNIPLDERKFNDALKLIELFTSSINLDIEIPNFPVLRLF
jgi:CRISPR-associated protein (TIGR02710 family)